MEANSHRTLSLNPGYLTWPEFSAVLSSPKLQQLANIQISKVQRLRVLERRFGAEGLGHLCRAGGKGFREENLGSRGEG